jgi:hypothetical protein
MARVRYSAVQDFVISTAARPTQGSTQPPIQWVSPGVKWQGREADHSPPFNAKVKTGGDKTPLAHMSSWHSA